MDGAGTSGEDLPVQKAQIMPECIRLKKAKKGK
jgi:hypothetical protein